MDLAIAGYHELNLAEGGPRTRRRPPGRALPEVWISLCGQRLQRGDGRRGHSRGHERKEGGSGPARGDGEQRGRSRRSLGLGPVGHARARNPFPSMSDVY